MTPTIPVHGTSAELNGIIVGADLDASGFETDEFDKDNPKSMAFTVVLEVADLSPNRLSYLPLKGTTTVTSKEREATGVVPVVRDGARVDTQTVIVQHDALEATDLFDRTEAVERAMDALDTRVPVTDLWHDLRGRSIEMSGVEFDSKLLAESISVEDRRKTDVSQSDLRLADAAEEYLRDEYATTGDEYWSYRTAIDVPSETILHLRFGVHGDHFEAESNTEGTLRLTRRNDWVTADVQDWDVDKAARAHERRHERVW